MKKYNASETNAVLFAHAQGRLRDHVFDYGHSLEKYCCPAFPGMWRRSTPYWYDWRLAHEAYKSCVDLFGSESAAKELRRAFRCNVWLQYEEDSDWLFLMGLPKHFYRETDDSLQDDYKHVLWGKVGVCFYKMLLKNVTHDHLSRDMEEGTKHFLLAMAIVDSSDAEFCSESFLEWILESELGL